VIPGVCFDVGLDLMFADKAAVGRCDPLKAAYAALPAGNVLVIRAFSTAASSLSNSLLFGIPKNTPARLAVHSSQLAFVAQVTAQFRLFGLNTLASLQMGNYPAPFISGFVTVCY
jgi:hypothetical protein